MQDMEDAGGRLVSSYDRIWSVRTISHAKKSAVTSVAARGGELPMAETNETFAHMGESAPRAFGGHHHAAQQCCHELFYAAPLRIKMWLQRERGTVRPLNSKCVMAYNTSPRI